MVRYVCIKASEEPVRPRCCGMVIERSSHLMLAPAQLQIPCLICFWKYPAVREMRGDQTKNKSVSRYKVHEQKAPPNGSPIHTSQPPGRDQHDKNID